MESMTPLERLASADSVAWINARVSEDASLSRYRLAKQRCARLDLRDAMGRPREMACRKQLLTLHRRGRITLPPARREPPSRRTNHDAAMVWPCFTGSLANLGPVSLCPVTGGTPGSRAWNIMMRAHHPQGEGPLCGAQIRYLIVSETHGSLGGFAVSAAAWRLRARDNWLGWTDIERGAGQAGAAFDVGPAEPVVARAQPPGRGGNREPTQAAVCFADDQVTDLRPAQRALALGVMRPHHDVPGAAARRAAGHGAQADRTQIGQAAGEAWPDHRRVVVRPPRRRLPPGRGQGNPPPPVQRQKLLAAGHLAWPAHRVTQVQPGAELLRQPIARQRGILTDARIDPCHAVRAGQPFKRRHRFHAANATSGEVMCPAALVGKDQGLTRPSLSPESVVDSRAISGVCAAVDVRSSPSMKGSWQRLAIMRIAGGGSRQWRCTGVCCTPHPLHHGSAIPPPNQGPL